MSTVQHDVVDDRQEQGLPCRTFDDPDVVRARGQNFRNRAEFHLLPRSRPAADDFADVIFAFLQSHAIRFADFDHQPLYFSAFVDVVEAFNFKTYIFFCCRDRTRLQSDRRFPAQDPSDQLVSRLKPDFGEIRLRHTFTSPLMPCVLTILPLSKSVALASRHHARSIRYHERPGTFIAYI